MRNVTMIRALANLAATAILVTGCVTNPVPEGYNGPLAKVYDTFTKRSDRAADFFYVEAVDGKQVENTLRVTTAANYGRGFAMDSAGYVRDVPAASATYTLVGRTHYAAPILELTNPVYQVKGSITFTPAPNRNYAIRGELKPDHAVIWVEDVEAKAVVGNKIERTGDTSLGFMEK
jgi:hypothetical protein